jgi:hypothetical protein
MNSRTLQKYSILYYLARRKNLKTATTCSGVGHRKDRADIQRRGSILAWIVIVWLRSRHNCRNSQGSAEAPPLVEAAEEEQKDYHDTIAQVHLPRML